MKPATQKAYFTLEGYPDSIEIVRIALALEYPLMQQGGTEVLVQELIRRLSRSYQIILVSGDQSADCLPAEFVKLISRHFSWDLSNISARKSHLLAQGLRDEGIALAHFHLGGTYEWSSRRFWRSPIYFLANLGVPCVSTNHLAVEWLNCGVNPVRPNWQKVLFQGAAWLSRAIIYHKLRLEVAVSRHDQRRLQRMFPLFKHKIIQLYHSLLPRDRPPPDLDERATSILCVGTVGGRKAQPILTEAFARIAQRFPEWELDLIGRIGEPADARRIEEIANAAKIRDRVHLLGRLTDEETLRRMQRSSIVAMPSLQEGLGLSLQEALFHGCVGVGSRIGGIPELVEHEINGLVVPPGDIPALSAALERLVSDPVLLSKLRAASRLSIVRKGMTSEAMVENYLELYQDVAETHS